METLVREVVDSNPNAPVMVIFGGNPYRMNEVISLIKHVGGITAYGAFSTTEGLELLQKTPQAKLALIGGRYNNTEREQIRHFVATRMQGTKVTEPGYDYPYENTHILNDIKHKLGLL